MSRITDKKLRPVPQPKPAEPERTPELRKKVVALKGDGMTGPRTSLPAQPAPELVGTVDPTLVDLVKRDRCGTGNGSGGGVIHGRPLRPFDPPMSPPHHHRHHHHQHEPRPIGPPLPDPRLPNDGPAPRPVGGEEPWPRRPVGRPVPLPEPEPIGPIGFDPVVPFDPVTPVGPEPVGPIGVDPLPPVDPIGFDPPITIDPVLPFDPTAPRWTTVGPVKKSPVPVSLDPVDPIGMGPGEG